MPWIQKLQQIHALTRQMLAGGMLCGMCLLASGLAAQQISVVGSFPRDGSGNLLRNLFISVKLDYPEVEQAIDKYTFTAENVRLYPSGSPLTPIESWLYVSDELKNITLQPKDILPPNTTFVFEITTGLQDTDGLPVKPYRCTFSTGPQGLDKPVTTPPGYQSEPREFAFEPGEGAALPPADFSDEIAEEDEVLEAYDVNSDMVEDFLVDITDLVDEDALAGEVDTYLPDETDPEIEDLMEDWEWDDMDGSDADLFADEPIDDISDVPDVVVSASPGMARADGSREAGMDTPDLFSIETDDTEAVDLEAEAAAKDLFEPETGETEDADDQPQPFFGYMPPPEMRMPRRPARDPEAEEIRSTGFLDFTAMFMEEGFVELRWEMESEFGNRYFSVERSVDGKNFTRIDTLHSLAEGGKKLALRYLHNDTEAPPGIHFYRIAYQTLSGEKGYSDIREVFVREKERVRFVQFAVFPNGKLPIEFKLNERRPVTVWILDKKGATVKKVSGTFGPGLVQKAIDMTGVPSGTYLGRIDARTVRTQREVVVLRP